MKFSKLKSGKSTGPVSVYHFRYPQTFEDCSPIKTTIIFNTSFTSGIVLGTDIKLANIIPVFKKCSQTCLSNYRPISLLSVFHIKLLEKVMYNT